MKEYHLIFGEYFSIPSIDLDGKYIVENHGTFYYKNGLYHREDGPAQEFWVGSKHWLINSKRHRLDGPASEYPNGKYEYWINGKNYSSKKEFEESVEYYLYKNQLESYQ